MNFSIAGCMWSSIRVEELLAVFVKEKKKKKRRGGRCCCDTRMWAVPWMLYKGLASSAPDPKWQCASRPHEAAAGASNPRRVSLQSAGEQY